MCSQTERVDMDLNWWLWLEINSKNEDYDKDIKKEQTWLKMSEGDFLSQFDIRRKKRG